MNRSSNTGSATPSESQLSEHQATAELIAEFRQRATKLSCSRKTVLFQQGEPASNVYLVRTGEVFLTMPISPAHVLGFRAMEGSLIGLPATFSNEPYSMAAEALAGSELEKMDRDQFWQMLIKKPALSLDVLRILAAETRSARIAIVDVSSKRRHGLKRKDQ